MDTKPVPPAPPVAGLRFDEDFNALPPSPAILHHELWPHNQPGWPPNSR